MKKTLFLLSLIMVTMVSSNANFIGKNSDALKGEKLTPEALWNMGRIGDVTLSPDGNNILYNVTYCSIEQNKLHTVLYTMSLATKKAIMLTTSNANETNATYINNGEQILFLSNHGGSNQIWVMNTDGTNRKQCSNLNDDIEGFVLSPDESKIVIIKEVESTTSIEAKHPDLQESTAMVINDLMYKHWDQFVKTIPHPFLADFNTTNGLGKLTDILNGEPYECPMLPFGGTEEITWSPDSKTIAYTCRKKVGIKYAGSTDSDIFLYNITTGETRNICKTAGYIESNPDIQMSYKNQKVNQQKEDNNVGYDDEAKFSPNGKYVAWKSMERDGYESDRARLCVCELATGKKMYVSEDIESDVNTFCWANDSKQLYFTAVWHGTTQIYSTDLKGRLKKLTNELCDYALTGDILPDGKGLLAKLQTISRGSEVFIVNLNGRRTQLTDENKEFYTKLTLGKVEERWVKTTDGLQEQCWIIYPPHFDPSKKYPTLLYCQGGPQTPISQGFSVRWNLQIMAANGYIVVAPNRRGLQGYGMKWLEDISEDYNGQCMRDLLSAIDDMTKESYVDKDRLGCVGASFGGYCVYWLAGHHNKRFKCFIAHDGIFNTEQQYMETEELWFTNWDLGGAPWRLDNPGKAVYEDSPHKSIEKWDTPILCIHGMKDYRILSNQGESAFNAAKMRGIPAQLLLLPDENHWVLKPQDGILWQRTFFNWLDKWLKQ
ncbi:MAG: S9 family peptidase [Prevotellaceae bacterium]|nr:S9 family peptidase [Candidatus Faecinaster equi]